MQIPQHAPKLYFVPINMKGGAISVESKLSKVEDVPITKDKVVAYTCTLQKMFHLKLLLLTRKESLKARCSLSMSN
jgi:hypothetical protein